MKKIKTEAKQWLNTIRGKLTLWFVGSVVIVFTVFVAITSFVFWQILNTQVDHHVQTVLNEVEVIWHQNSLDRSKLIESLVASQGMIVMVMAPDGEILLQTASSDSSIPTQHEMQRHLVKLNNAPSESPHFFTINNTRFGLITTPIAPNQGAIGVGFSLTVLGETIKQSLLAIVGLAFVFILLFGVLGQILAKKALAPVSAIISTAQEITTSKDLKGRIIDPGTADELGTLVSILNDMLGRLERSFTIQQQFFADAAHTLKTPMTVVRTQLERIQSQNRSSGTEIRTVIRTIDQVSRTIKDLLYLSKVSSIEFSHFEVFNLTTMLDEVCELAKALASEKDISVACKLDDDMVLSGDKSLLLRSILNVVENAVEYTPENGTINITAAKDKDNFKLVIQDNGIGIPAHQLDQVYSRFFRGDNTKDTYQGTGLGLSITKAVVEGHSGTIDLDSQENKGTTVVITLPA